MLRALVRNLLLMLALFLFLWSLALTGLSYPHLGFMALGALASLGAGVCIAALLKPHHPRAGMGLTLGSAVCLVLLSWSPSAALASVVLLVVGVTRWVKGRRRPSPQIKKSPPPLQRGVADEGENH